MALQVNEEHTKRVSSFKYLGAMLNDKCDDDGEVRIRVGTRKKHVREITHISGLPRSANGPEDENDQVLHLASVSIWYENLIIEDQVD